MATGDRSISEVLQGIVRDVQDIIRSEVRLAKAEIREDAARVKPATVLVAAGAITGIFAILFLLLAIVYALTLVMPSWAAAAIVGAALAGSAGVMINGGLKRFKRMHPVPDRTIDSIKENLEWARQQTK